MIRNVHGVISDLVFGSQIQQGVAASGLEYRSFRSSADVDQQLAASAGDLNETLWIINLAAKSSSEPELVETVLPKLIASKALVVCYAPHVEEAKMAWAQSQGAAHVVPRGALMKTIGQLILSVQGES